MDRPPKGKRSSNEKLEAVLEAKRAYRRRSYGFTLEQLKTYVDEVGEEIAPLRTIRPSVLAASADELIARGWGEMQRSSIPADWRERRGPGRVRL